MKNRYLYSFRILLILTDILLVNCSFFIAYNVAIHLKMNFTFEYNFNLLLNINLFWIISSIILRLYSVNSIKSLEQLYRASWKSTALHMIFFMLYLIINLNSSIPRSLLFLFYFVLCFSILASRFICTVLDPYLRQRYQVRKIVAVMGMNDTGNRLATYFKQNQSTYRFEGFLNNENALFVDVFGKIMPGTCEQIKQAAARGIQEVYVSLTPQRLGEAIYLLKEAEKQFIRLKFVPDFTETLINPFRINFMESFPIITLRTEPLENADNGFKKRVFDILFSGFIIVFVLIWLFPLIALIIKMESKGPVLFRQLRSGRNNKNFWCYKFRSMSINSDCDSKQAGKGDSRITAIGRFLRRTSIDEFPQFFNVFLGNMSIVGPRPHMLKHTEQYSAIIDRYMVRHYLKPGITGWAQVNGYRGETYTKELMEQRVNHDIWYLENWSLMLDVKIIFQTVINMVNGDENAY
ncbi:undecaprenyl-phosphate glucose phosphotransferase [Pedobacter immunditicola]|uniref:undecaprenyl-phosphate glucose phosphotransferase n=1 Tax=Pedobacter immunditicola TaxID=3133440 RepID=UPI0030AE2451